MKINKEDSDVREVVVTVDMEADDVEPFLDRAYRRVVNRVRIAGFRPGKAPRAIVENVVGKQGLIQEAVEFMVPETLDRVLEEEGLRSFGRPDIELLSVDPTSFKAVILLEPTVDLGDFRNIRLERGEVEVTDEDVSEALEQIRYDSTPWEPADRPATFGDLLTLDVKGVVGELPTRTTVKRFAPFILSTLIFVASVRSLAMKVISPMTLSFLIERSAPKINPRE